MRRILLSVSAAALAVIGSAHAETINNDTIIQLVKAGLSDGLIIDKINSEACNYDVQTSSLIALKQAGVPDTVTAAMVRRCATFGQQRGIAGDDSSNDPMVKHSPGIYAWQDWAEMKLVLIRPSSASGAKTTGNGSLLFPFNTRLIVPGEKSHTIQNTHNPNFYFYFNVSDQNVSDFGSENSLAAQSQEEFSLVQFKKKNSDREVTIGKLSLYLGVVVTHRQGIDPKYTIPFQADEISKGTFKISFEKPLASGDYGFIFSRSNGKSRIYDFTIPDDPKAAGK